MNFVSLIQYTSSSMASLCLETPGLVSHSFRPTVEFRLVIVFHRPFENTERLVNIARNKKAFQWDAYRPLATCTCFSGHHQMLLLRGWGPQVNKFWRPDVSSRRLGPKSDVQGGGGGSEYLNTSPLIRDE